jgi:phosphoglycerate dehydrogenase-like enzyme
MPTHVLIAVNDFNSDHMDRISLALKGRATWERIDQFTTPGLFLNGLSRSQVAIGWPEPAWLDQSQVQFLQLPSAGYDSYLAANLDEKPDFVLCNARGVMSIPVAEHFLALMLALVRKLPQHIMDRASSRWQRGQHYGEVLGSKICIVGLGDIGSEIARRCLALGMHVTGVREQSEKGHELVHTIYSATQLKKAVAGADHVVLIFPAGPGMEGSFGDEVFAAMKPGALFYNLARGSVVDERALISHLQTGHLGGAGLDVFTREPLPQNSPLWTMDNVIVTPHVAGRSFKEFDRMCDLFTANLERFFQDRPLLNQVIPV